MGVVAGRTKGAVIACAPAIYVLVVLAMLSIASLISLLGPPLGGAYSLDDMPNLLRASLGGVVLCGPLVLALGLPVFATALAVAEVALALRPALRVALGGAAWAAWASVAIVALTLASAPAAGTGFDAGEALAFPVVIGLVGAAHTWTVVTAERSGHRWLLTTVAGAGAVATIALLVAPVVYLP